MNKIRGLFLRGLNVSVTLLHGLFKVSSRSLQGLFKVSSGSLYGLFKVSSRSLHVQKSNSMSF
jgi:hypothetical protein